MNNSTGFKLICPANWKDYELIDCGNFQKLERFGQVILCRPEPQAIWDSSMPESEWQKRYHAKFETDTKVHNGEKGKWIFNKKTPETWLINYESGGLKFKMALGFNTFKHIGIFPEQADNWDYIFTSLNENNNPDKKVLNLFAYTGGASLASAAAGAETLHVDSVKQVINRASENARHSNINGIKWIVEDALKFVQREQRRGKLYNGIILDPPAFGHGPDGEKWILEKHLNEILKSCASILLPKNSFLILNLYSLGFSGIISENLIKQHFPDVDYEYGENYLLDSFGKKLPLGTFIRFSR
jgi:23S rRNA (cytosine1962-C5)-methyltransferase